MAVKPTPGLDVPVIVPQGQQTGQSGGLANATTGYSQSWTMNQVWYEYFQSLLAFLNSTATSLAGVVQSIDGVGGAFTLGYGLLRTALALRVGLTSITNSIGADVALNNTANYFDGPSVAQGTTGTWFVSGTVSLLDTGNASFLCKLWDGTTVIASSETSQTAAFIGSVSLSGVITSPAANLRISVRDINTTAGKILFNQTGNSKDSTITAVRIA